MTVCREQAMLESETERLREAFLSAGLAVVRSYASPIDSGLKVLTPLPEAERVLLGLGYTKELGLPADGQSIFAKEHLGKTLDVCAGASPADKATTITLVVRDACT